jgi:hypothetical protein
MLAGHSYIHCSDIISERALQQQFALITNEVLENWPVGVRPSTCYCIACLVCYSYQLCVLLHSRKTRAGGNTEVRLLWEEEMQGEAWKMELCEATVIDGGCDWTVTLCTVSYMCPMHSFDDNELAMANEWNQLGTHAGRRPSNQGFLIGQSAWFVLHAWCISGE